MAKKKEIHPFCKKCLKEHNDKWYVKAGKVFCKDPTDAEDLQICSLIEDNVTISQNVKKELTEDEIALINYISDPVKWGKYELNWVARWYQELMLKCLSGDQVVFMSDGTIKKIKDIEDGELVVSYNKIKRTKPDNRVIKKWYSGKKDVYKIILSNGDTLECTDDHPILAHYPGGKINKLFGKKSLVTDYLSIRDGLSVGSEVYTINEFDKFGDIKDVRLAKILGYLVSDSYINFSINKNTIKKNIIEFCNTNKKYIDEFVLLIKDRFTDVNIKIYHIGAKIQGGMKKKEHWKISIRGKNHSLAKFLIDNNIFDKSTREINIFNYAFKFDKSSLCSFLNRSYSGDGSLNVSNGHPQITYCSGDSKALELLRYLLKKIGIYTSHIYYSKSSNGVILLIRRVNDCLNFISSVGSIFGKEARSLDVLAESKNKIEHGRNMRGGRFSTSRRTKIKSIEHIGKKDVYDIQVENRENFISQGIIVHNCTAFRKVSRCGRRIGKTEAIVTKMLHYAYTNEDVIVLVIAPYKNQVGMIFDKIDSLLAQSEAMSASIKRNTKNPYRVELHNRAKILGFTAGTRTGSKSTGIRGQDAHLILIDEADYLSEADFEVILAIQASRPDVNVWCSSTPTGKRDMFWRFCTEQELGYKEFHFPSSASPSWTKQTERLERAQYSDQGYKHEFDAEFGEEAEGVFLNKFIDEAIDGYSMDKVKRNKESIYTIGVDWNTAGNGTVIIVTEWNKNFKDGRGAFRPVEKKIITQEEFTQVKACEKIIELNAKWDPAAIYVDQGYGHTQIEMLRKYGIENPKTGIVNKLKGIYFGDKMEIRDPITKQIIKKHMKPFIVNLTARRLEDGQIILPELEDLKHGLIGQFRDYTVIRTSALGQPIYSDDNEHSLIAFMLSVLAATMEFSDITKQNRAVSIGLAGKFGEKNSREFKVNRKELQQEKKKLLTVVPRWGKPRLFNETTLRNSLDQMRMRDRANKKNKSSRVSNKKYGDLLKSRSNY